MDKVRDGHTNTEITDGDRVKWTSEEDENLKILVSKFGEKNWKTIATFLPGRTELQCLQRSKSHLNLGTVKNGWTKEEDDKLTELVDQHGTDQWSSVAKSLKDRLEKDCQDRWRNHLESRRVKNTQKYEEELIICKAHSILGDQWAQIAKLLPGSRSESCLKTRWFNEIKPKLEKGHYGDEFERVVFDIEEFVEGELDFKCDAVIDAEPITTQMAEPDKGVNGGCEGSKQKLAGPPSRSVLLRKELSSPAPSSPPGSGSSPGFNVGAAPTTSAQVNQRKFVDAALRMVAEDMLPLSFVEGSGFRSFVSTISPEYDNLSQRAVGLRLYEEVEKTIKPQLIRDLKACLSNNPKAGQSVVHVTFDLWAGDEPAEEPVAVVQLHFVSDSWQICRPVVAFRHLSRENLSAAVAKELDDVLLSYGIFPHNVGHLLAHQAKETLTGNKLFCDYKITSLSSRGEPDGHTLVAFLSDQMSEPKNPFSQLQTRTRISCVAAGLQLVIMEALKNSRVVENLLSQVQNVLAFFRNSTYWCEVLLKECNLSLFPSSWCSRWNSMMLSLRRLVQESAWSSIMTLLTQARTEASDTASAPPLVRVKREQIVDILGLLEPFEEALQVLQGNGVTISFIIPSLVGLDKTLESRVTNYTHFNKALRTGLHSHFQSFIQQEDMILAALLDPRIKLQPFPDAKLDQRVGFLTPPTKDQAHTMAEAMLQNTATSPSPCVEAEENQMNTELKNGKEECHPKTRAEPSGLSDQENCAGEGGNQLKRKSIFNFLQPPVKTMKTSELTLYLAEPLCDRNSTLLYWKSATRFPKLQALAKRLLSVPATSGGFDRLWPLALCIVRAKRNQLPPHTTERLLLYKNSLKTKSVRKHSGDGKR